MISITDSKRKNYSDVNVYPNPVKNKLFIDSDNENTRLKIFNLLGEKVHDEKLITIATSIDVCNWNKGHYVVVLESTDDLKTFRIEVN